jgi:DNA-binding CsgD family transcriptional regulator
MARPAAAASALPAAAQAALFEDAHARAFLLDRAGVVLAASPALTLASEASPSPVGLCLADLYPDRVARERAHDHAHALSHRTPRRLRGFLHGCWTLATARPAATPTGEPGILWTIAPITDSPFSPPFHEDDAPIARHHDLGPLAALSARELEVLRLLGLGLTTSAIAETLQRSAKTVEGHRVSLGAKLRLSTRVEVARVALAAGLTTLSPEELGLITR